MNLVNIEMLKDITRELKLFKMDSTASAERVALEIVEKYVIPAYKDGMKMTQFLIIEGDEEIGEIDR